MLLGRWPRNRSPAARRHGLVIVNEGSDCPDGESKSTATDVQNPRPVKGGEWAFLGARRVKKKKRLEVMRLDLSMASFLHRCWGNKLE